MPGALIVAWVAATSAPAGAEDRWRTPMAATGLSTSAACVSCHPKVVEAWQESGHRRAWTDPLFQAGFAAEPQAWCAWCHAPLPEMRAEVARNALYYASRDPRRLRFGPPPAFVPEPLADEGVTCVACHQPDGGPVRGPWTDGEPGSDEVVWGAHPVRNDPALTDGTLCRGCHDFPAPSWLGGAQVFSDLPMQSTYAEWARWRDAGGAETCVSCHFASEQGPTHHVRGAHDRDWLSRAVEVEVTAEARTATFVLRSVGVGHAMPTGDLYRHLTLEVGDGDGWREVARIGRSYGLVDRDGVPTKILAADTSLQPGVPFVTRVVARHGSWRLVWHDGDDRDETRGWVDPSAITAVLAAGTW